MFLHRRCLCCRVLPGMKRICQAEMRGRNEWKWHRKTNSLWLHEHFLILNSAVILMVQMVQGRNQDWIFCNILCWRQEILILWSSWVAASSPTEKSNNLIKGQWECRVRWVLPWDIISSIQLEINEVATATWDGDCVQVDCNGKVISEVWRTRSAVGEMTVPSVTAQPQWAAQPHTIHPSSTVGIQMLCTQVTPPQEMHNY